MNNLVKLGFISGTLNKWKNLDPIYRNAILSSIIGGGFGYAISPAETRLRNALLIGSGAAGNAALFDILKKYNVNQRTRNAIVTGISGGMLGGIGGYKLSSDKEKLKNMMLGGLAGSGTGGALGYYVGGY